MNKYRQHAPVRSFLRWLAAALAATMVVVGCGGGGGGGGEDEDPTTPTIAATSVTSAVVRKNDTTPLPAAFAVTVTDPGTGTVAWRDESGASRGSGNSLALSSLVTPSALAVGPHTLTASITNPRNGRSAQTTFSILVLADTANTDDDDDGLTYDEEKTAGTQPGNADSDNDGLADGAEQALGTNPALADSNVNGTNDGIELANNAGLVGASLPSRSLLATQPATTGVQLGTDALSVTFGSALNPGCVNRTGSFSDPVYDPANSSISGNERCSKRAVRANVGIAPGEFRYFETRRFSGPTEGELANIGQGIITPTAQIDPYCCYFIGPNPGGPGDADYATYVNAGPPETPTAANPTPASMTVNSIGGVFSRLILVSPPAFTPPLSLAQTQYYGFAVDYRGSNPVVYLVGLDASGNMIVSNAVSPGSFDGAPAMPFMHGHPIAGTGPHAAMNLGASKFRYSLTEVRDALTAKGVADAAEMVGGVGIHRWKVPAP
jgi:hypothetical protein